MHSAFAEAIGTGTFGYRLRVLRASRDMTTEKLASKSGLDIVTVSRVQRDGSKPQKRTVESLARALDVPPEALTGD